jgi:hypothetical protein
LLWLPPPDPFAGSAPPHSAHTTGHRSADLCSLGVEPGDAVDQRRLTRARGTHDGGEAAGGELDSHAVQRAYFVLAAAVDLDGLVDPSGRRGRVEKAGQSRRPVAGRSKGGGHVVGSPLKAVPGCCLAAAGGLPNSITVPLRVEVCLWWIGVMVAVMSLDLPWKGCDWMTPRSDFQDPISSASRWFVTSRAAYISRMTRSSIARRMCSNRRLATFAR